MTYPEAVAHLYSLGPELTPRTPGAPLRKFDLAHMRTLCAALGNPQDRVPSILIAGTNGKGSTAATLASIFTAAGYRTGLYTSPHLIRPNERIQLAHIVLPSEYGNLAAHADGPLALSPISDEDFATLYTRVDEACTRLTESDQLPTLPSFFERLTALAFLYFAGNPTPQNCHPERSAAQAKDLHLFSPTADPAADEELPPTAFPPADIMILEVGLGGRLDATNIVTPLLSIITDIALDHQEYLGNTIAEITTEKCGILRENGILITLPQLPEANQSIGLAATTLHVRGVNAAPYIPPPLRHSDEISQSSQQAIAGSDSRSDKAPNKTQPDNVDINGTSVSSAQGISANGAPLYQPGATPQVASAPATEGLKARPINVLPRNHYTISLEDNSGTLEIDSPLPGHHQQRNIALAIAAALEIRNRTSNKSNTISNQTGYNLPNSAIEAGIRNTQWPGRLELITLHPDHRPLLLDVAHNPAGAWTLRSAIAALPQNQPRTLIFSCLKDKSLQEMSRILFPLFDSSEDADPLRRHDHIILAPISSPRAAPVEDLVAAAKALGIPAHAAPHLAGALAQARQITPANGLILATGSVYLVGEIRELALEPTA
jgi:dihydrofolate synthase/folylpolyglutamate synthase